MDNSYWKRRRLWRGMSYKDIKVLKVDGTNIKADTWYRLVNGKITEDGSITEDESITEEDLEEWNTSIKND